MCWAPPECEQGEPVRIRVPARQLWGRQQTCQGESCSRGSAWIGHPYSHRQLGSIQASREKDAMRLRSEWGMLFLEGSLSCFSAGFLCPERLPGKIKAGPSTADTN